MKSNFQLLKKIMLIVLPAIIICTSIAFYIQSMEFYDGGFDSDLDYIVVLIVAVEYLGLAIYNFKNPADIQEKRSLIIMTSSAVLFAYPLGKFIKNLIKNNGFQSSQQYLYVSIFALALLVYGIFDYLDYKKNKNN